MHKIVSPDQDVFLEGRLITDNGFSSQEIITHVMKRKSRVRRGRTGRS